MITVAIDPGHPSEDGDTGSISPCGRIVEPDYTIHIARKLKRAIEATESQVHPVLLRERNDEVVPVSERARRATEIEADLVVSIHVDSWYEPTYHGANILYWPGNDEGRLIATQIASSWPAVLQRTRDGSAAHLRFWPRARNVLGAYKETAILGECGYASNPRDVDALIEDSVQAQIVGAFLQGILYCRQMHEAHWLGK